MISSLASSPAPAPAPARVSAVREDYVSRLRFDASRFAREEVNNDSGWVCINHRTGVPFRWSGDGFGPEAREVEPGVFCVRVDTGAIFRAEGGDETNGAQVWALWEAGK